MFSISQIAERQSFPQQDVIFQPPIQWYRRMGKNRGEGAVGVEEKMTNDDLVMYLTFHTQMVDNV